MSFVTFCFTIFLDLLSLRYNSHVLQECDTPPQNSYDLDLPPRDNHIKDYYIPSRLHSLSFVIVFFHVYTLSLFLFTM
ncbi:unnamed protein product [Rhizophagus irregularis]|nr:unnamed protein product [Rhizophagus irregularis]